MDPTPKKLTPGQICTAVAARVKLSTQTIDKVMRGGHVRSPRDQRAVLKALAAHGFTPPKAIAEAAAASAAPSDGSPQ